MLTNVVKVLMHKENMWWGRTLWNALLMGWLIGGDLDKKSVHMPSVQTDAG